MRSPSRCPPLTVPALRGGWRALLSDMLNARQRPLLLIALLVVLSGCSGGDDNKAQPKTTPSPAATRDLALVRSVIEETATLPASVQGHTKAFGGKDGSTLASVASEYRLAASDVRRVAPEAGDGSGSVSGLADALDPLADCLAGSSGDFYLSDVTRVCPTPATQVETRRTLLLDALPR